MIIDQKDTVLDDDKNDSPSAFIQSNSVRSFNSSDYNDRPPDRSGVLLSEARKEDEAPGVGVVDLLTKDYQPQALISQDSASIVIDAARQYALRQMMEEEVRATDAYSGRHFLDDNTGIAKADSATDKNNILDMMYGGSQQHSDKFGREEIKKTRNFKLHLGDGDHLVARSKELNIEKEDFSYSPRKQQEDTTSRTIAINLTDASKLKRAENHHYSSQTSTYDTTSSSSSGTRSTRPPCRIHPPSLPGAHRIYSFDSRRESEVSMEDNSWYRSTTSGSDGETQVKKVCSDESGDITDLCTGTNLHASVTPTIQAQLVTDSSTSNELANQEKVEEVVQKRLDEERKSLEVLYEERLSNVLSSRHVVYAESVSNTDEEDYRQSMFCVTRKKCVCAVPFTLFVIVIILCSILLTRRGGLNSKIGHSGEGDSSIEACPLCYGTDNTAIQRNMLGFECAKLYDVVSNILPSDSMCAYHQAVAWKNNCSCAISPPVPEVSPCDPCQSVTGTKLELEKCQHMASFVALSAAHDNHDCKSLWEEVDADSLCECSVPENPRLMGIRHFLESSYYGLESTPFNDKRSDQYWALEYLAFVDPYNLSMTEDTKIEMMERYVCILYSLVVVGIEGLSSDEAKMIYLLPHCQWTIHGAGFFCKNGRVSRIFFKQFFFRKDEGRIPTEIVWLSELEELVVQNNNIGGTLPPQLGHMPRLQKLDFEGNSQLGGLIPDTFFNSSSLKVLHLARCNFNGSVPFNIGSSIVMHTIQLGYNSLTGSIPTNLGQSIELRVVSLDNNELEGPIPEFLPSGNLVEFDVSRNKLTGTLPISITSQPRLKSLLVEHNRLTGTIPSFGVDSSVSQIDLRYNSFVGGLDDVLENLLPSKLELFATYGNWLNGTVPTRLGLFTKLEFVWFPDTDLTGSLPSTLGRLTNTKEFSFANSRISGTIPSELGLLTNIRGSLQLSSCDLVGTIPTELGKLTSSSGPFNFSTNFLTGTMPSELGRLTELNILDVTRNELTGTFPQEMTNMTDLYNLRVGLNKFSGTLDAVSKVSNVEAYGNKLVDVGRLCGSPPHLLAMNLCGEMKIDCSCCEYCCDNSSIVGSWCNLEEVDTNVFN